MWSEQASDYQRARTLATMFLLSRVDKEKVDKNIPKDKKALYPKLILHILVADYLEWSPEDFRHHITQEIAVKYGIYALVSTYLRSTFVTKPDFRNASVVNNLVLILNQYADTAAEPEVDIDIIERFKKAQREGKRLDTHAFTKKNTLKNHRRLFQEMYLAQKLADPSYLSGNTEEEILESFYDRMNESSKIYKELSSRNLKNTFYKYYGRTGGSAFDWINLMLPEREHAAIRYGNGMIPLYRDTVAYYERDMERRAKNFSLDETESEVTT